MSVVNVTLGDGKNLNLPLGRQGENAVTAVVFDFSAWATEFGSGTLSLSVQRHGDELPYAVTLTTSGTNATWTISDLDTAYKGAGEAQLKYTVGTVVKKSTVYKFTVHRSLGENGEYPSPGQTWQEEIEADIADVKQDLAELEGGGLSDDAKQALLDCIAHIGLWTDDHGQDYYDALYDALYPPAPPKTVVSISAVYTQSGTVYDTDTLDSLKTDLVVTATYDDSTTGAVTAYALSGTLEVGTSTITVSYSGKTTTFTVTVTEAPPTPIYQWENLGTSLVDSIGGITATTNGTQNSEDECIDLTSSNRYISFGEIYDYDRTYIIEFGTSNAETLTAHARFFGVDSDTAPDTGGDVFAYRNNGGLAFYVGGSWSSYVVSGATSEVRNMFGDSTMKVYIDSNGYAHVYKNSTLLGASPSAFKTPTSGLKVIIGSSSGDRLADIQVKSMTVYSGEVI